MKHVIVSGVFLALATLAAPASASDILGACKNEIENRCADVTLGNGRLMSCLYAYEDQLDAECGTAMADAADILDPAFRSAPLCEAAVRRGHPPALRRWFRSARGRIYSCLSEQSAVSEGCKTAMSSVRMPSD